MTTVGAIRQGVSRALGAPGLLASLWIVNLLAALPLAATVARSIHDSVGRSLVHRQLVEGFDTRWYGELEHRAQGVTSTFRPAVVGAGAFFENLEAWWSGRLFAGEPAIVGAALFYTLVWALLLGGVIERLSGGRKLGAASFFGAGGRFLFRFLRLAVAFGILYYLIYRLSRLLFATWKDAVRDVTAETPVLLGVLLIAALTVGLLTVVRVVSDYAKIAIVLEERRSVLGAVAAGARFVVAHPIRTLGLYCAIAAAGLALLAFYHLLPAAGPRASSWLGVAAAFALTQLALVVKLGLRLATLGGECGLYGSLRADPEPD